MIEKINIYSLKNILKAELSVYDEKKKRYNDAKYQSDMFRELISLFTLDDIDRLHQNLLSIGIILPILYPSEEAKRLQYKIQENVLYIEKLTGKPDLKDQLKKYREKLNKIVEDIEEDYSVIENNLLIYEKEYLDKKSNEINCRKILFRLNHKHYIDSHLVDFIRDLLKERNTLRDYQILIMEYINRHNINVKYPNPKFSYTTIKMIESDFELYELEDLMDKDERNKLDSYSISIFNSLMQKPIEELEIFLDESTSWMEEHEKDYILKLTLNSFLTVLNEKRTDMLDEGNYEDETIRRVIIEEYNSYYYKYIRLEKYYYNALYKNDEVLSSLVENDDPEENPSILEEKTEKNNIFFAMRNTNSYFEHDLERYNPHYLETIRYLLDGFKYGTLLKRNVDGFTSNKKLKGYKKLKQDQVRIVFRQIKGNNYLVLGMFEKKENEGTNDYVRIVERDYNYRFLTEEDFLEQKRRV